MRAHFGLVRLLPALLLAGQAGAQSPPDLRLLPESRVWVEGTSTKSDWTVNAAEVEGSVTLSTAGRVAVGSGRFSVASEKLQSGRSPIMDRLMHGALKTREHPAIRYEMLSASPTPSDDGRFVLATRGRLTLAGETREIESTVQGERLADGRVRFTGSYPLLMSEYGMTPPSAMLGALRVGDRVVVHFDLVVKP